MPMLVIAGDYRIVGAAPDGDSVRFYPDDPAEWDLIPTAGKVKRNTSGGAQLRMDGIDALETHYTVEGRILHQPLGLGQDAAAALLRWLGFRSVSRNDRDGHRCCADGDAGVRADALRGHLRTLYLSSGEEMHPHRTARCCM